MSIKVMTWVWNHSRSKKNARLLLLAVADCASDDGSNAYPSVAELVRKTGLSERGVQSTIVDLVNLGELKVFRNAGPGGCNRYSVVMTPAESAPPQDLHPADSAPPADSAGADPAPLPQNLHPNPAEPAPVTVLEPKNKISSSKRSSSEPRGTRLPADFEVTDEMRDWVRRNCPDVRSPEHDRFCDYWRAQPGAKGRKTDWVATWRNWMRTAQERAGPTRAAAASTTDRKVAAVLDLKNQIRDIEQRSISQ